MNDLNFSGTQTPIQSAKNLVDNVINQFIVRPQGGRPVIGAGGFVFDIIEDEEISIDSDITDHYVEANSAIQDHIALRAERFTLRGYVGELTDIFSNTAINTLLSITSLSSIGGFMPEFAAQAANVYTKISDVASKVGTVLNQAQNLFDLVQQKSTFSTKQQQAFQAFYSYWSTKQLLTVETPFVIFENMAIESIRSRQRGDTRDRSDFSITFKKMRFASTHTVVPSVSQVLPSGSVMSGSGLTPILQKARVAEANSGIVYKGNVVGQIMDNGQFVDQNLLNTFKGPATSQYGLPTSL